LSCFLAPWDSWVQQNRGLRANVGAAVSILETYHLPRNERMASFDGSNREVRGLARMVQVSPTHTLVDLTIRGVAPGTYRATIREYGDLKDGATSAGPVWASPSSLSGIEGRGVMGSVEVGKDGRGSAFINHPFQVWEVIGHAIVVSRQDESAGPVRNDAHTLVGIVARSAGIWENDKTVCSCSGKTLWEERRAEVERGML
jgi:copper chaperone for superoxide dismutase